jgi:uncharacterized protein YecE (DUF72 family)
MSIHPLDPRLCIGTSGWVYPHWHGVFYPPDLIHIFEFRDPRWFVEPVRRILEQHGLAFCIFDMPGLSGALSPQFGIPRDLLYNPPVTQHTIIGGNKREH